MYMIVHLRQDLRSGRNLTVTLLVRVSRAMTLYLTAPEEAQDEPFFETDFRVVGEGCCSVSNVEAKGLHTGPAIPKQSDDRSTQSG